MSHFRVENARFRILKGGKIGLSLSIALLGSLAFCPIDAHSSTTVLSNTTTTLSSDVTDDYILENGSTLETTANITGTIDGDTDSHGTLKMEGATQTITGNIGSTNKISELQINNGTTTVDGNINATTTNINNTSTLKLSTDKNISSAIRGSGNLILEGGNTVSDIVDMTGNIRTNGNATFNSSLTAGNLNIISGTTAANGDINATTTNITSTLDAKQNIKSNITGTGTLKLSGTGTQELDGNISSRNTEINSTLKLKDGKEIDSIVSGTGSLILDGNNTIKKSVDIDGNITANGDAEFQNRVEANNLNIASGTTTVKGNLDADVIGSGNLTLQGNVTASEVINLSGDLNTNGTVALRENVIVKDLNVTGGTTTADKNITTTGTTNITNSSTLDAKGNLTSSTTNIGNGSTLKSEGNITGTVDGTGTLTMSGTSSQTVTGSVGNTQTLNRFNINNDTAVTGDIKARETALANGKKLDAKGNITGNINGAGTLEMSDSTQTITGNIGNATALNEFKINSGTTTVTQNINANNINLSNGSTLDAKGNITGTVSGLAGTNDTLKMSGTNQVVDGTITLDNFQISSGTTTAKQNVTANTTLADGTTLKLENNLTTGNINGAGTLEMNGSTQTIRGDIGTTNQLTNFKINGGTTTVNGEIKANNTTLSSGSTLDANKNLTGNITGTGTLKLRGTDQIVDGNIQLSGFELNNSGTTTVKQNITVENTLLSENTTLKSEGNITGNVKAKGANTGTTLTMDGSSLQTVSGNIGESSRSLNEVNINNDTSVSGNINSNSIILGSSKNLSSQGNIKGQVSGNGTLTMNGTNSQIIDGEIGTINNLTINNRNGVIVKKDINSTTINGNGTLIMNGSRNQTISSDSINLGNLKIENGSYNVTALGDINASNIDITSTLDAKRAINGNVSGTGTLELSSGNTQRINGNIAVDNTELSNNTTLELAQNQSMDSNLIGTGNLVLQENNTISKSVNINGDVSSQNGAIFEDSLTANNLRIDRETTTVLGEVAVDTTFIKTGQGVFNTITSDLKFENNGGSAVLNNGLNGDINFNGKDASVTLNRGIIDGSISVIGTNGVLKVGGVSAVLDNIGSDAVNKLKEINTIDRNADVRFEEEVFVKDLNINEGRMTFDSTLNADNTNIENGEGTFDVLNSNVNFTGQGVAKLTKGLDTGRVTTNTDGIGTLEIIGDEDQTINGEVGDRTKSIFEILTGVRDTVTTFIDDVYSKNITSKSSGETIFKGEVKAENLELANGTMRFEDNATANFTNLDDGTIVIEKTFNGEITGSGLDRGAISFEGDRLQSYTGSIQNIRDLDIKNDVNISGDIKTANTNIVEDKVLTTQGDITSNLAGLGTLKLEKDGVQTLSGSVNTQYTKVGEDTTLKLLGGTTLDTLLDGNGTLELVGNSTISNKVGSIEGFGTILASNENTRATFRDEVNANIVNIDEGRLSFDKNLTADSVNIKNGRGDFSTLNSNINFTADGIANLNNGIDGNINFNQTNATVNIKGGNIQGEINSSGTSGILNIDVEDGITTFHRVVGIDDTNRLKQINATRDGSNIVFEDQVFAENVNINNGNMTFKDNLSSDTTTIGSGTGTFNSLNSDLHFTSDGTANISGEIIGNITTARNNKGIINLTAEEEQVLSGTIGAEDKKIKEFNIIGGQTITVDGSINATDTSIKNNSTLQVRENQNLNTNIKSDGTGDLKLFGSSIIQQAIENLGNLEINADGSSSIFERNVDSRNISSIGTGSSEFNSNVTTNNLNVNDGYIKLNDTANAVNTIISSGNLTVEKSLNGSNLNFKNNGTLNLADNANLNVENITSEDDNFGIINIAGNSNISSNIDKINSINILGSEDKIVNLNNDLNANITTINSANVNFNKETGNTNTNLIFTGDGTANLYNNLIGDIDFQDTDAVVNVKDGGILAGTVSSENVNGTINYEGGGHLGVSTNEDSTGNIVLGTLNVNTKNNQNKNGEILPDDALYIHRDIYADRINLRNNATLVLDDANLFALNSDKLLIVTDENSKGDVIFNGSSIVDTQIAQDEKRLSSINAGTNGSRVVFNEQIFADNLDFSGNGTVVLNKEFDSTVDFKNRSGKLELGDGFNINESGAEFKNANYASLKINGDSTVNKSLGDKNYGTSTFKNIELGNDNSTVNLMEDVYVIDKLDVIGNGLVNLAGNLHSNLNLSQDGIVTIAHEKSVSKDITSSFDGRGTVHFAGETLLKGNVGTQNKLLREVAFGTKQEGRLNQTIDKDIYATRTIIGNGENSVNISFDNDTKFGGALDVKENSTLNIFDNKVVVEDNLTLGENSKLNYYVYTNSLIGNAQENGDSGKIVANKLHIEDDARIHINYNGNWEGEGQYNIIETNNNIISDYYGNEKNGLVTDNSIIDSVVVNEGKNLVLKADRTSGGTHRAEDLYIVKSEIGSDYSNGASQSLAGYANNSKREKVLGDIISKIEHISDGVTITDEKKAEMIDIQRKLAPKANNATVQSAMNVSKVSNEMVSNRISDIRRDIFEDRLAYAVDNSPTFTGYSSGDDYYYDVGDSTLWIKASYTKATQDGANSYDGYKTKSYGATAGIDKIVGDDVIFGISASYFDTNVTQSRGNDTTKSYRGTIYGSSEFGLAYVDANVSFAHHETDSSREANSGNLSSKIKAQELSARVETGLNLPIDDGSYITPYVAAQHTIYKQKAYQEKGTKYQNDALKVDAVELNTTSAEVGAKLTGRIELENALIIPHLSASVTNNFNQKNKDVKAQFVGGGTKFSTPHQDLHKTIYSVGTGFEARITNNSSIILDATYDRSKDGKYRAYGANISFGYSF